MPKWRWAVSEHLRLQDGHRVLLVGGYWTGAHGNFAVVAVLNPGVDWAAYIGGIRGRVVVDTVLDIANHGAKLPEQDALKWFAGVPDLSQTPLGYRH